MAVYTAEVVRAGAPDGAAVEQAGPPPPVAMMQMITGAVWVTKSIYVAATLGIADLVADGPQSIAELAQATDTDPQSLYRVLRALASLGIFAEDAEGRFGLTPMAGLLQDKPGSLKAMAELWGDPVHWQAWSGFLYGVRTGTPGWEHAMGKPLFVWFHDNPEYGHLFDAAMSSFSAQEAAAVVAAYDFSGLDTIVDVGGGQGLLLATILQKYPQARGILFDLPQVVESGGLLLREFGVDDRVKAAAGNFFESVPEGGNAYLLKNILHDFRDDAALKILTNIRRALAPGGKVLVVQEALPAGNTPSVGKLLDMQMLLIGGQERTEPQYRELFKAAGLRLTRVIPTPSPLNVIEGVAL